MELDPWAAVGSVSAALTAVDPKVAQLGAAKKALALLQSSDTSKSDPLIAIALACADGDVDQLRSLLSDPENIKLLAEQDNSGLYPLTYAVAYNNDQITELILSKSAQTLNEPDGLFGYTPLMWAVYLGNREIATELLNHGARLDAQGKNGIKVKEMVKPGTEMYDFFEQHGLFESETSSEPTDDFYKSTTLNDSTQDDELISRIKLQTAGLSLNDANDDIYQDSNNFVGSNTLFEEDFNFNKLLKNEYILFSDYDIPAILDLIFTFNTKYNHKTTYPAAVLFQCVRYADHIKDNALLVENFLNLAFTQIRSNTSSKGGVTNVLKDGDIVQQSYWLSVVNFLYYYLCKDEGFFKRYPKVLQELITTSNSLIIELTNSIKFRLNSLIDECLLDFTNIPDITSTLYKNDWNFFKKKTQTKSTFDDIYQMLYPPSIKEQLKPSPIKIIQTLGALLYVLDLHHAHPLVTQQAFSIVFQWLSNTLFNRIISQKKYLSRAKAIQIRLNISVLEDWARSNNKHPRLPDVDRDLLKKWPYTLIEGDYLANDQPHVITLSNVLFYNGDIKNPSDLSFYHNSLFEIVKYHFEILYQLLEFLQCFTTLQDEESIASILENLNRLNSTQILKVIDKYRYELEEHKFDKKLYKKIQAKAKNESQAVKGIQYSRDDHLYLNADFPYPVALPTIPELVDEYGSGLGGINKQKAVQFLPNIPYEIVDMIDEIHEQKTKRFEKEEDEEEQNDIGEDEPENENGDDYKDMNNLREERDQDDGLFGELKIPSSLAHRTWGVDDENEANPW